MATLSGEPDPSVIPSPRHPVTPSSFRAWCYLIRLSVRRQARAHLMVWIALGLLAFITFIVALNNRAGRWGMSNWRYPFRAGPSFLTWTFYLSHAPPEALRGQPPS